MFELVQNKHNRKVYNVNGKTVEVWKGSLFCLKCGRPLTDPHSQKIGYGPDCAPSHNQAYREMVVLAIGGEVPEKIRNDSYHAIIKIVAPNTACTGIAVGSDKPALAASDNQSVTEAGSPALR